MPTVRLPVSRLSVHVRPPGGVEDMLLADANVCDRALAITLIGQLASVAQPADLAVHDFEALLLQLHALVFGGRIEADATCLCHRRINISFAAGEYLQAHAPRQPRAVTADEEPGWFRLDGEETSFRLPTAGDQIAVADEDDPVGALAARCLRPVRGSARIERAMVQLAPPLSGEVIGTCPYCQAGVPFLFDVPSFVLGDLQVQARLICEDVHCLAGHYHWSEGAILALPTQRRQRYVAMVAAKLGVL
jgi:hypothetical protein